MRVSVAAVLLLLPALGCSNQHMATVADLAGVCPDDQPNACPLPMPSYKDVVAPIVAQRCAVCHATDGDAPKVPLSTYGQLSNRQVSTLTQISTCMMPPTNDPTVDEQVVLSHDERTALLAWLVCGAPDN